jgi:hypothetical protein
MGSKTTTISFDMLSEVSEYLFKHQNQKKYYEIETKVVDFLFKNGTKKFLQIYNKIIKTNDYIKALEIFKI